MPADRVYVAAVVNGQDQFYQRETERKGKDGRFEAVPFFVLSRSDATVMSEPTAKMFVARLRSMRVNSAWIEDARDGRRIEFASESTQSGEDTRVPMKATQLEAEVRGDRVHLRSSEIKRKCNNSS